MNTLSQTFKKFIQTYAERRSILAHSQPNHLRDEMSVNEL